MAGYREINFVRKGKADGTALTMGQENEVPVYGEVCIRKIRRRRQRMLLTELFMDFSKNTTLHGLRYVTQSGLEIVEKIFWVVTFVMSIALSFYFIYNVWHKWRTSPVIVSFSEKHLSVEMVPFPAVTICPQVKSSLSQNERKKLNETIKTDKDELYHNYTEIFNNTESLALLCKNDPVRYLFEYQVNASVVNALYDLSLDPEDAIYNCHQYMGRPRRCSNWIKKVLTKDGVCFNFNGLAADEIFRSETIQQDYKYTLADIKSYNWTMKDGYLTKDIETYPMRGLNSGETRNMVLKLKIRDDIKIELCNQVYSGYKIYLHHPADLPQTSAYYFAALPDQLSSMALKFSMVTTSNSLRSYPLETRQCYFPEDKWLKYFQIYTYNNCKLECLSNFTYNLCGCVAYYMPHNNSNEVCGPGMEICLNIAKDRLKWKWKKCNCLPSCNYINYDAEIHKDDYPIAKLLKINRKRTKDQPLRQLAKVDIFFKDPMFMSIHRSELFGLTDFLGQCGGLLGLFLGFSFLSLVEIFYFITFRVFYTIKTDLKREKAEGYQYDIKQHQK